MKCGKMHGKSFFIPRGYKAGGVKEERLGLGIILSEREADFAAVMTSNKIKAACLKVLMKRERKNERIKAVVVNSGNANAFTGEQGIKDAEEVCEFAGKILKIDCKKIIPASTGIIGRRLEIEKIKEQIKETAKNLGNSEKSFINFARAILTTDSRIKISSRKLMHNGKEINILAIAKGAGMISPELKSYKQATMLCFIISDINAEKNNLQKMLEKAAENSFNKISIDGDRSTNDLVLLLANGIADNSWSREIENKFYSALEEICREIALKILKDGEGVTKVFRIEVVNARDDKQAEIACKAVANSLLVKTAVHGSDPNFGRVIASLGASGIEINESKIEAEIRENEKSKSIKICEKGKIISENLSKAKKIMENDSFELIIDLNLGKGRSFAYACDLSCEYIKINSSYSS